MLAVDPAGQGRGVGTALVAACLDRARAEGRRAVFLHSLPVMEGAQRIYARFGFRRVPDRDWVFPGFLLMGFELDLGEGPHGSRWPVRVSRLSAEGSLQADRLRRTGRNPTRS